jgi:Mn2+/Fe2+ NRAMP family transporter
MFTDAFAQIGLLDYRDARQRGRWITGLAWFLPATWTVLFITVRAPVIMVMAGGFALCLLLLMVIFAALHFRYRRLSPDLRPSRAYDLLLWVSCFAIAGVGVIAVVNLF